MRQYLATKRDVDDAFLFFRLGDFYELFFEDAVQAAKLLGLTLTSRNKQDPEPIPMCGIPWHQRDSYVARLLRLGHKVAICDQLEDPAQSKGLVQRGVTEVLTPGSVTGEAFLESAAHNFLAALWPRADRLGLCLADASTGEMKLAECAWEEAGSLLSRTRVAEWLLPAPLEDGLAPRVESALAGLPGARSTLAVARWLDESRPPARWSTAVADAHADLPLALAAAAAALDYLDRTQGGHAAQMTRVERWSEEQVLRFDAATARHLELFAPQPGGEPAHTLWHHLNLAVTSGGARRLRGWLERPLASLAAIHERQEAVAAWLGPQAPRGSFREALRASPARRPRRATWDRYATRCSGCRTWRRASRARAWRRSRRPRARSPFRPRSQRDSRTRSWTSRRWPRGTATSCATVSMRIATRCTSSRTRASAGSPSWNRASASARASPACAWASTRCSASTSRSRTRTATRCQPTSSDARRSRTPSAT
jgi:DNA mismatch repair protein MutS